MGLFDKLKSMKNFVTGGGAKVTIEAVQPALGRPFEVIVRATVSDAPLSVNRVYVVARGEESVDVSGQTNNDMNKDGSRDRARIQESAETFKHEINIAPAATLAAGSNNEWRGTVQLPSNVQPSYVGKNAKHRWFIQGGLDVTGNDPDSGWVEVYLR